MEREFWFFKRDYDVPFGHDRLVPYLYYAENRIEVLYSSDEYRVNALIKQLKLRPYCSTLIHTLKNDLASKRGGKHSTTQKIATIETQASSNNPNTVLPLTFTDETRKSHVIKLSATYGKKGITNVVKVFNDRFGTTYTTQQDIKDFYREVWNLSLYIEDLRRGAGDVTTYLDEIDTKGTPLEKAFKDDKIYIYSSRIDIVKEFLDIVYGLFMSEKDVLKLLDDIATIHPYKFKNLQWICDACKESYLYLSPDLKIFTTRASVDNPIAIEDFLKKGKEMSLVNALKNIDRSQVSKYLEKLFPVQSISVV